MADHGGRDPVPEGGRRPAVAAGLVLVLAALTGELRAPAPVLPTTVTLAAVALAATGLAVLVRTTGTSTLVAGRELRAAALVPIGLVTFLVVGPRFRLIVAMLWLLVGVLTVAVAIAAVAIPTRRRDGVTVLVAVVAVTVGGWFGEGVVREARLAVHADRYRSEAEALVRNPPADTVYPHALDEPFLATRELDAIPGDEAHDDPIAVAWLWDPGEDGPARSWGVLYAPDGGPQVQVRAGGHALRCTAAVVDDLYWCDFV